MNMNQLDDFGEKVDQLTMFSVYCKYKEADALCSSSPLAKVAASPVTSMGLMLKRILLSFSSSESLSKEE